MAAPRLYSTFLLRMLSALFERLPEVGDQKAIRTVAQTFRANPSLDSERVLQELEVGEALTSFLNARGEPSMAQRTLIRPPMSRVGALIADGRQALIGNDFARAAKYGKRLDQPSARERLQERHLAHRAVQRQGAPVRPLVCRAWGQGLDLPPANVGRGAQMHRLVLLCCLTAAIPALADPALNSAVSQATIGETICTPGYAASVRLPWSTLKEFKRKLLEERGESWVDAPKYELDHIIPVCLGGAPGDLSNLQLQPWDDARRKDRVEIQACRCVCAGKVPLAEAQHDLATDWQAAYHKYAVMICRKPR